MNYRSSLALLRQTFRSFKSTMIRTSHQFVLAVVITYATAVGGVDIVGDLKNISLRFYFGTTMNEYTDYSLDNVNALQTKLINDRRTVLYIHGFTENLEKKSVHTIVQAYLKRNDHNIIAVNYAKLANESYPTVVKNVANVGAVLALALDSMVQAGFNSNKLHIVGHSMGSQVAGHIGRKVSFQVPRITGLDPAGPLFNVFEERLSLFDAHFVDIIHTDYGFYGISRNTGTLDFFPNGGRRLQPGCPQKFTFFSKEEFCSHHRSWEFYAESLINESSFLGVQCPSWSDFLSGECNNYTRVTMGYGASNNTNGSVYLITAAHSPFGLRKKGTQVISV
ncbi:pancreatic triacylglycerol lipase-like isoform X2 [Odontomachus brunneus]|uniref:pancreatic triacylglycerol lipase-like isoform X2 n=1 Tax=Odontomachus brunneus TaxID=486640 RepID=UPI0013F1FEB9|nr:pancreatic triacylglycerol lipase-like isoform X2 [Odontomachus brunneus]